MSAAQFCSACLTAQPYVNLTTHSAHMSERPEVSEKGQGRVLRRTFKRKKGKKQTDGGTRLGKKKHAHAAPIYSHACTRGDL